jgi:hypothetical protein
LRLATIIFLVSILSPSSPVLAENPQLYTDLKAGLEYEKLDNVSLGNEAELERLTERDYEIEFDLEYRPSNDLGFFLTAALVDENEQIDPAGIEKSLSGMELKELGLSYHFGDTIQSEIKLGRIEYESSSHWWSWWDDELDSISLQSRAGDVETLIVLAEEQLPRTSADDFIDPELDDLKRLFFNLSWEIADGHSLELYYLKQRDSSPNYNVGELVDDEQADDEDADLSWHGFSYLAELDTGSKGSLNIELHYAEVAGYSTLYEFEDPESGRVEVSELIRMKTEGQAFGYHVRWTPNLLENLSLIIARAKGSGDSSNSDNFSGSFRQTGIQGDLESFGELLQPELSNLEITLLGLEWQLTDSASIALLHYDYQQDELSDSIRDARIEADPSGTSRELGKELDLVFKLEHEEALELKITYARFKAGQAFASSPDEESRFIGFDISYTF